MLNQCVLVGRMFGEITIEQEEIDAGETIIMIDIKRAENDTIVDRLNIVVGIEMAKNVKELCRDGAVIGFKARAEGTMDGENRLFAEKITIINAGGHA